jgi:EAL and modified HD-GYP domain-containing signal transduction protein
MATTAPARPRIGRQSVHDVDGRVVGYELLFHAAGGTDVASRDASTSEVIGSAFGELAVQHLGSRRQLYVNTTRAFLTGQRPLPFPPQGVVLEVLGDLEVDAAIVAGAGVLKSRGFRLAVDGWATGPAFDRLLPIVDVVKVDVAAVDPVDLPDLVAYVGEISPYAQVLADGVRDAAELTACRSAGFDLYQGPHLQRPAAPSGTVSASQLVSLQLLAALADPDTQVGEIERIVSADPGITLRVLGAANSASGAGRQVGSLRQALVLMGRRTLSSWVVLAALHGRSSSGGEQLVDVLTRARTCELLGEDVPGVPAASAYAAGLVSGVGAVLGADVASVVRSARLDELVASAILQRAGVLGALLDAVEEFDGTGQTTSAVFPTAAVSRAHLHALGSAMATVGSLVGD